MRALTYLLLLITASLFWGCSEEISEEIQADNTSSATNGGGSGSEVIVEPGSIRVTNNTSGSYIMHREGSLSEACELQAPADGFDTEDYANNNPDTAIDCILDAEEFDLYFGGAEIQLSVDENLCEYIEYRPFKYLQWQPGISSRAVHEVSCDDTCSGRAECNQTFATRISGSNFSNPTTSSGLCEFDYSDELNALGEEGPNCDNGVATITSYNWSEDPNNLGNPAFCIFEEGETTTEDCGGEQSACYGGAATTTSGLRIDRVGLLIDNPALTEIDRSFSVDSPFSNNFRSNMHIASYSRICSSTSNTKIDADFDASLIDLLGHEVEAIASASEFEPIEVDVEADGTIDYRILADNPFQGIATSFTPRNSVTPYYSIRCLDSARDVKAHVRVHIREWDRVIDPENVFLVQVSDVNQGTLARMDSNGEQAEGSPWNDFLDWDDHFADFDLDLTTDQNPDDGAGALDPIFVNNQCVDVNIGVCFDGSVPPSGAFDPAFTNQTTCEAASTSHRWIPGRTSFPEFRQ